MQGHGCPARRVARCGVEGGREGKGLGTWSGGSVESVKSYEPQVLHSDATIKNMSASERRMLLFESFGSAKKQRALKSQAANVVNIDSVISAGSTMLSAVQSQDGLSESNRRAMEDAAAGRTRVRFFLRSCWPPTYLPLRYDHTHLQIHVYFLFHYRLTPPKLLLPRLVEHSCRRSMRPLRSLIKSLVLVPLPKMISGAMCRA